MAAYLARRVAAALLLVLLVLSFTFFFIRLAPGDPTAVFGDPRVPPAHQQALERAYGLDQPLPRQYAAWLSAVLLDFEWGTSFVHQEPVRAVLLRALPRTLLLAAAALLLQFGAGLVMGIWAARRAGALADHAIRWLSLLFYAMPAFWLGLMAILLFSHVLPLFPTGQMRSVGAAAMPALWRWTDILWHLALPALVLGAGTAGGVVRFTRASLLEVLRQDYIRGARAKGVGEGALLWTHALRAGLAPILQLLGLSLPLMLSGALVVEVVFSWPGMGRLTFAAIQARDYPLILAATALAALLVIVGSLLADIAHAWVDPRVRLAR